MKAAFSIWNGRIAPVFDVSRHVRILETGAGGTVREYDLPLPDEPSGARAARLAQWGIGVLVCGAISNPMQRLITAHGISVIPFVAGDAGEIVRTWLEGTFSQRAFSMPGCSNKRRYRFKGTRLSDPRQAGGHKRQGPRTAIRNGDRAPPQKGRKHRRSWVQTQR
ncbi:MAG: hypothetical protein JRI36_06800 [Deltaproteobacteria bacterium]|nr:hypothetical protein [Deltaproteobacteria bacterium]